MTSIAVLLIEDDEDDVFLTTELLESIERREYEVTWAADPTSALSHLRSGDFDVCLVDNRLGATTGIDILRECAEAKRYQIFFRHDCSVPRLGEALNWRQN